MPDSTTVSDDSNAPRPLWIVGAGAVGITLAALLSAERRVTLVARAHRCAALRRSPLRVSGSRAVEASPQSVAVESLDSIRPPYEPIDLWLAVKANDVVSALSGIAPLLPPSSAVSVLSNGLGIFDDARASLPSQISVLRVLPSFGAYSTSPTETRLAGELVFTVAGERAALPVIKRTAAILRTLGAQVETETNVRLAEYRKAVINLVVNPLCALADRENGAIGALRPLRSILPHLLREIDGVARAEGVALESLTADELVSRLSPHASNLNSMLIDIRSGRRTEVDYITGRFLAIAQRNAVPTPLLRSVYDTIKAIEQKGLSRYGD